MTGHEGSRLQSAYYSSGKSHDYYFFIDFTKFCFTKDQKATSKRSCIDTLNIILSSVYIKNSLICWASHFIITSHFNKNSLNLGYVWQFCNLLQLPSPLSISATEFQFTSPFPKLIMRKPLPQSREKYFSSKVITNEKVF